MKSFDLNSCRSKLEDHYQKTATVPTSVWSKKSVVDIHQIYTRLSWVKDEQTPAGTTQSKLKHYCDLFSANKNGAIPKRILVQGQTGIGKSTFVKKLLVDWVGVNKGTGDEQAAVLKNFELVVAVNLKEVSKCQNLKDVIRMSNVFAKEDKYMTEGLVDYITNNQEKVLLIFDGYDEYRCGCNSEIYEIFNGKSLRNCRVLITTRISKADELRGGEDLQAEITGFSQVDRNDFMRRFLSNDEILNLREHLFKRNLNELAKVPLLLLFLCTLWKKGQSKYFPKTKTKLYLDIIEFVLNHSHSKQSTPRYVEVASFKDILSEMGKVALQGLLNDDHLFEYSQLSDSVRCDESVFIGLLQITEYSETLRPVGLVSFIHKSIQEFLAAWYVTYRCIPEGRNLGEIGVKLEECLALENVFQFICGLSKDGASTVLRHLKSVRISDPSLDLSKAIPDVENETDEPLSDVTNRQEKFRDLVLFSFAEVQSEAELSSSCLDSLGNILLVSDSFPNYLLEKAIDTNSWSLVLNKVVQSFYKILFTKGSKFLQVAKFFKKFNRFGGYRDCDFSSVICFRNGQVFFYITQLELWCENHARLFTDRVDPFHAVHSTSGQLCVKFLKTLECHSTRFSMESLGAVIKYCNHLERIDWDSSLYSDAHDSVCYFLEQVPNPDRCSLSIEFCALTSTGAVKLASLLPRFENVTLLCLYLVKCSIDAATRLVAAIKHKTLKELLLRGEINLTSAVVEALCQSLSELSALEKLKIVTSDGYGLATDLRDRWSLPTLKLYGLTDSSAEVITRLIDFFDHNIYRKLKLREIHLTPAVAEVLIQLLPKLSALRTLKIKSLTECSDEAVTRSIAGINHKTLEELELREMNMTSAVAESLGRSLPELSALRTLEISGSDGCKNNLSAIIDALCQSLSELSALEKLRIVTSDGYGLATDLRDRGSLPTLKLYGLTDSSAEAITRLIDVFDHNIYRKLKLREIHLTPAVAEVLIQLLPKLSALRTLKIKSLTECSDEAVTRSIAGINHKTLEELELREMNMTSAVAESLGRSLPELSALRTLRISGSDGCSLQHKELEALFGRFSRPSSLTELCITRFSARGSLGSIANNLCFFPSLRVLELEDLNMGEADLSDLLENLKFTPNLRSLSLIGNPLGHATRSMIPYLIEQQKLEVVYFRPWDCSEEDLKYVQEAVNEKRPRLEIEMSWWYP